MSLRRDNGKTIKVPLAKLSKEDHQYVLAEPKPKVDPVAALEELGAKIQRNSHVHWYGSQGEGQLDNALANMWFR